MTPPQTLDSRSPKPQSPPHLRVECVSYRVFGLGLSAYAQNCGFGGQRLDFKCLGLFAALPPFRLTPLKIRLDACSWSATAP